MSNENYMRARYYDPETGRFISEDPAGLDAGVNLYAYVVGNPISRADQSGLHFGLAIIGTPVENSFPFNPPERLINTVSSGIGGLAAGGVLGGPVGMVIGGSAGLIAGAIIEPGSSAQATGYINLLVTSAIDPKNLTGTAVTGFLVESGVSNIVQNEGDPIVGQIFASTLGGAALGPRGSLAGLPLCQDRCRVHITVEAE